MDGFWVCVGDDADWVKTIHCQLLFIYSLLQFFFLSSFIFLYVNPPFSFLVNKN